MQLLKDFSWLSIKQTEPSANPFSLISMSLILFGSTEKGSMPEWCLQM